MANTYTKIILHFIFACRRHDDYIPKQHLPSLHAYLCGVIRNLGSWPIIVNGTSSHVHILMDFGVKETIANMVKVMKVSSNRYINSKKMCPCHFEWQDGYACFSANASDYAQLEEYIRHQEEHHANMGLEREVRNYLSKAGVEFDERYIFHDA